MTLHNVAVIGESGNDDDIQIYSIVLISEKRRKKERHYMSDPRLRATG